MIINNLESYLNSLSNLHNPLTAYNEVIGLIGDELKANSCLIADENNLILAESPNTPDKNFAISKLQEVIKTGIPKLFNKQVLSDNPSNSIIDNQIISLMVLPMYNNFNQFVGALYIDRRGNYNAFNKDDFDYAKKIVEKLTPIWIKKIADPLGIGLIYSSDTMGKIINDVKKVAVSNASILITGESGVGKELIAKAIHLYSRRNHLKMLDLNCAAIPKELVESELFGHEKGAFTSADQRRIGKFEQANKSILFLDEIGDLSMDAQLKLLRALQENKITRVGSNVDILVDVRVIAATNKNLLEEVENKKFREDLYYRINVIEIKIPPLRNRLDDIQVIAQHFFELYCKEYNKHIPYPIFTNSAIIKLKSYNWPGNIRELKNYIHRLVIFYEKNISVDAPDIDLKHNLTDKSKFVITEPVIGNTLEEIGEQAKAILIEDYMKQFKGNIQSIADELGTTRQTIWKYKNVIINRLLK